MARIFISLWAILAILPMAVTLPTLDSTIPAAAGAASSSPSSTDNERAATGRRPSRSISTNGTVQTHYHYCDGGPSINALSDASPLISDCKALMADIDNLEWSYKWISCHQHALVSHGTCVFGIETVPDNLCLPWTTIETGNGDIIDWIQDSIDRWGGQGGDDGGKVGSLGYSKCHNTGRWGDDYLDIKWGLYHT